MSTISNKAPLGRPALSQAALDFAPRFATTARMFAAIDILAYGIASSASSEPDKKIE
jgi:hypothetical protein